MKTVVAGALGECVHVAGVLSFLHLAEEAGWHTVFLGPAVPVEEFLAAVRREKAELAAASYRLTPETGQSLLHEFKAQAQPLAETGVRFVFGGTPPVAEIARGLGIFERCFDGSEPIEAIRAYLAGRTDDTTAPEPIPQTTLERIAWKSPVPLLRHHFGQPTVAATVEGIRRIAEAGVLDVVSIGPDQDAQENFFHPERQDPRRAGAGGVPVRSVDDYRALYAASRRGNYPLLRTYSGTDDFIRLAEMYVETIHIAWGAVPLFWFNRMDERGPWDLEGSIREHQKLMAWYAARGMPVEVNEPHHWGLRYAPDVVCVAAAYLSAYNARAQGVRDYIAQLMFNSPRELSDSMDLAKMLAMLTITQPLAGPNFHIWRQTRTGLLSYPLEPAAARAHLAASVYLQMALHPHIVHVVSHSEAHHAAKADDVIEACQMAHQAIANAQRGAPDMTQDPAVQARSRELTVQAHMLLERLRELASPGVEDPLTDPTTLARAVSCGYLDAPHLRNNRYAPGRIVTRIDERGACVAVDPQDGRVLDENARLAAIDVHRRR